MRRAGQHLFCWPSGARNGRFPIPRSTTDHREPQSVPLISHCGVTPRARWRFTSDAIALMVCAFGWYPFGV